MSTRRLLPLNWARTKVVMLKRIKCYLFCADRETGEFVTLRMFFLNNVAVTDRNSSYGQGRLTASYLVMICHVWDDLRIIHQAIAYVATKGTFVYLTVCVMALNTVWLEISFYSPCSLARWISLSSLTVVLVLWKTGSLKPVPPSTAIVVSSFESHLH